jgi:ADP-ribosylglycohydrolase
MLTADRDHARAVLLGLALGDALGRPVEFLDRPQIRAMYGRAGIQEPPTPAIYTDETQMSLAVAEALADAGHLDLDVLMGAVARKFIGWKHDPSTPQRAPGVTSIRGVNALEAGAPWREAGVRDSKGSGSCVRVAPVGFFFQADPARLERVARAQGVLTHRHPTSDAACTAAAYLVKLGLDGAPVRDYLPQLRRFVAGLAAEFDAAINRVEQVLEWGDVEAALSTIGPTRGGGWVAEEAVAMALYCVLRHPDDYVGGVRLAANITGDSDSVASLAGGMLGARLGLAGIPAEWTARLEDRDLITGIADRLSARRSQLPAPGQRTP